MSDELNRPIFRRKRRHIGEKWKPQKDQVLTTPGIYCPTCHSRHAYKNKKHLGVTFEKRSGAWHILWYCKLSGTVVKDERLL